jgi:hypothetical protein
MTMSRFATLIGARTLRGTAMVCLATVFFELACGGAADSREIRSKVRSCTGPCSFQVYPNPNQMIGHDGQVYGLRSGGEGPLNASGSYGAMLEGRNPVGSTGF